MSISFDGIGEMAVTFEAADGVKAGIPVKIAGNGKVEACGNGDRMCGVALFVSEDNYATVQLKGFVKLEYSGDTDPTIGYGYYVADGTGKIAADNESAKTGGEYLVVEVDTTAKTAGLYI